MSERSTLDQAAAAVQNRARLRRCRRVHIEEAAKRLGIEIAVEKRPVRVISRSALDAIAAELRRNPPERRLHVERRKRR